MRFSAILTGLLLTLVPHAWLHAQGAPAANTGWYNGDWRPAIPGYSNWYVSGQQFARTYDDFVVPAGGWTIAGVFSQNAIYSSGAITAASWEIRSGVSAGNAGTLVASGLGYASQTVTSAIGDGSYNYWIQVSGLHVQLAAGTYWLSVSPVIVSQPAPELYVCATLGLNAVGNPQGSDGKAFFYSPPGIANALFTPIQTTGEGGTSGDFSMGVLLATATPPAIASVVNAASFQGGGISPGEVVTITGTALGPALPASLSLDEKGNVATSLSNVQVLFGGFPAPLAYVSGTQINAVVPYEITGLVSPAIQVNYGGQTSNALPVTPAAAVPALFTSNGSGTGPAAILNQDNSYNAPNNPAAKGSYIVIYMTGEGQTSPAGVTGKVTVLSAGSPLTPQPLLPVVATIGGQPASVVFYGEAPGVVAGVMQLDVQIPTNAASGNLPISISVGANTSQNGVTVSVQ